MDRQQSFVGRINRMSRGGMLLLGIPVLVSLVMMVFFSGRYRQSIRRMETIAGLKPAVSEEIPDSVWDMVSGRTSLAETPVYDQIRQVKDTIRQISEETGESDRLALIVAGRTMDTLTQYVNQIWNNIKDQAPVVENETVLEEVWNVAALVESMLNDYITAEIGATARMGDILNHMALGTAGAEIILLLIMLALGRRTLKRTEAFIRAPIRKLESVTAQLAEGDMRARIPETDVAELRNLTRQVNGMADNLEAMMERNIQDERRLKKAELRTLQAQINPHFLYNTLDAIMWKAEAGDQEGVIHLTGALSDFFRISLSSGADWIPISQEKKHLAGYLSIQQTRYRDILQYEIDIPEELGEYYILKLLLQPLVENALYHGIKYRRGGGRIVVTGRLEGETLVFTVRDTGAGMDAATLQALQKRLSEEQPVFSAGKNGFGLVNVGLRLRLYYNQPDGLRIESGSGGTTVTVRVPRRTREEVEHDQRVSGG